MVKTSPFWGIKPKGFGAKNVVGQQIGDIAMRSTVTKSPISAGQTMMLLKKFLMSFAIALYSVGPVFAGDSDRVRSHWQGQGVKMFTLKAHQHPAWRHLKRAHREGMRASARDLQLTKKRLRTAFQSGARGEGLISRYKHEYQITVGRNLTRHQRLLVSVPSHWFRRGQSKGSGMSWSKGSGMRWDKGSGKSWGKGCDQGWGQRYGKNSNKRHGMGGGKNAVKRGDRSRGDKSQKNRKKKLLDSD
jgi:hypothetical protein